MGSRQTAGHVRAGVRLAAPLIAISLALAATGTAHAQVAGAPAVPISSSVTTAPDFVGKVAKPDPRPAAAGRCRGIRSWRRTALDLHNDAYQTDTYRSPGPLGREPRHGSTLSAASAARSPSTARPHRHCLRRPRRPVLALLDPETLRRSRPHASAAGAVGRQPVHRLLRRRLLLPRQPRPRRAPDDGPAISCRRDRRPRPRRSCSDYDLSGVVAERRSHLGAARLEGAGSGSRRDGMVGWIDPAPARSHARPRRGDLELVRGRETGGVFIVTDAALYRFQADGGAARSLWRRPYPNTGELKPGQTQAGLGDDPTLIAKRRSRSPTTPTR